MNAGPTSVRVYQVLRDAILRGEMRPGTHLDPVTIAGELAASTTPVREALCRLTGEDLLETRQGSGFMLPLLDEPKLQDLYAWTGDLVALGLRSAGTRNAIAVQATVAEPDNTDASTDYADASARVFAKIVAGSSNSEHGAAMARANAQLHPIRMLEPDVLSDAHKELQMLTSTAREGSVTALRQHCATYLRRRRRAAAELLRRRYR
ncbi:GntR family transcriptional regulator [Novosphingobium sp. M1R2S20]|uniref:GntR family transcriptional regulator n=1 Tax=Novosphingobium rhizovicinum TaxID=3228928 RepID=A0ABV3RFB2_9SPHN